MNKEASVEKETEPSADIFSIVGIGAPAGATAACTHLFSQLPADSGIAFVIVQQGSDDGRSPLDEALQTHTAMPVHRLDATGSAAPAVAPDNVYVAPPGSYFTLASGRLHPAQRPHDTPNGPIAAFFLSLAQDRRERAIGVLLAGDGLDDEQSVNAVQEHGGLLLVQQEDAPAAPPGADRAGAYRLPLAEIPAVLLEYVHHSATAGNGPGAETADGNDSKRVLPAILRLLHVRTGHDFSPYKRSTVLRRIARRMSIHHLENAADYLHFLRQHEAESDALFKEMLIGVTSFFRDPDAFAALEQHVIPAILARKADGATVRVWAPGCATGEEAYSLAMLLAEALQEQERRLRVQIFATDLDEEALAVARAGVYPESIADDVTPARLRRFFRHASGHASDHASGSYEINKEIREMIIFGTQNLVKDPPFSRLDLISCRNLLIYLDPHTQRQLVPLFHYALNENGYLFLGPSESVNARADLFAEVDTQWAVFRRRELLSGSRGSFSPMPIRSGPAVGRREEVRNAGGADSLTDTLLRLYAPPCVIINERLDIVYFHGRTGQYLEPAHGAPTYNILRMARPELRLYLRRAIFEAQRTGATATQQNVSVRGGLQPRVNLIVRPFVPEDGAQNLLLVLFEPVAESSPSDGAVLAPSAVDLDGDVHTTVPELQEELRETRSDLRRTIADLEAYNEELETSNEALLMANEELETSREELQSLNEELSRVNAELQVKVNELARANSDINNLLVSTHIATLILDRELRITRFTPSAADLFGLLSGDAGRPLRHIVGNLQYDALFDDIDEVLATLVTKAAEVQTDDGRWHMLNILPYRTVNDVIDGVVLTFTDISPIKQAEKELEQRFHELHSVHQITEAVSRANDLPAIYTAALDGLETAVGCDRAAILQLDAANVAQFRAWRGLSDTYRAFAAGHLPWSLDDPQPRPILVADVTRDPSLADLQRHITAEGIAALAFIPLLHDGRLLGKFMLYYNARHDFSEAEIRLAQTIANTVAFALERQSNRAALQEARDRLEERVEQRTAQLKQQITQRKEAEKALQRESAHTRLLQEIAVAANEAENATAAFRYALDRICDFTGWPLGHVYMLAAELEPDGKRDEMVSSTIWHCAEEHAAQFKLFQEVTAATRFARNHGWLGHVFATGKPAWITDVTADPNFVRSQRLKDAGVRAGFAFPVLAGSEVVAVLEFFSPEARTPDDELLAVMAPVGAQLGRVVERERAEREVRRSRDFYLSLFHDFPALIWRADPEGQCNYFNQTWLTFTGRTLAEEVGEGWAEGVHPDDYDDCLNTYLTALAAREPFVMEYRLRRHDGVYRWISDHGQPYHDVDGNFAGYIGACYDITEERDMLRRLRESERLLNEAQRVAHLGSWQWDLAGDEIIWSDEHYHMMGYEPGEFELSFDVVRDHVHPEDRDRFVAAVTNALETGQPYNINVRKRHTAGHYIIINARGEAIIAADGRIVKLRGTAQDVTEQKELEQALRHSEASLATAQHIARLGSWEWTVDSGGVIWSEEMYRIYGVDPETFVPDYERVMQFVHPDDTARMVAEQQQLAETKQPYDTYYRIIRPDGRLRHLQARVVPALDERGEFVELRGTVQDVTEQREMEIALRHSQALLAEAQRVARLGSWEWDITTGQVRWSQQMYTIFGLDPEAFVPQFESIIAFIHPEDKQATEERAANLAGQKRPYDVFFRIIRPDRHIRHLHSRNVPVFDDDGELVRFFGTIQDVTGRREMEIALRHSETMLAEAQRIARLGSFEWDAKTGEMTWSAQMYRIYGLDPEEFTPSVEAALAYHHPEDRETAAQRLRHLDVIDEPYEFYYRIVRPDGAVRTLHARRVPIFNEHNALERVFGTAQDVTEQRETEIALRQSEARYRTLARNIPRASVILFDHDLRVLLAEGTLEVFLKRPFTDAIGKSLWELLPQSERDNTTPEERLKPYYEALEGRPQHFELNYGDDTFMVNAVPLRDDQGHIYAGMIMSQDITERKEIELHIARTAEQLAALNEMGQAVVASLDLDTVFARVLAALRPLLGAEGIFVLLREPPRKLRFVAADAVGVNDLTGVVIPEDEGVFGAALRSGEALWVHGEEAERRVSKLIGELAEYYPQTVLTAPLYLQEEIIGVMEAVHTDPDAFTAKDLPILEAAAAWTAIAVSNARLYDQVQANQDNLRQLTEQLVNAQEEERMRVSRELHDEAGQALTALQLHLSIIGREIGDDTLQAQLQEANRLTEKTMERIRLLAYDLRPPELDTLGLGAALEDLCHEFARRTRLAISFSDAHLPSHIPDAVSLSFYRFLQEALTNVTRHAQATEVDVALDYNGEEIRLTVSDDGRGFPLDFGTQEVGLGLLGMKERFERLNGVLEIASQPGKGTRLTAVAPW